MNDVQKEIAARKLAAKISDKAIVALNKPGQREIIKHNGGVRCDTIKGPCSCGAWH